MSAPNAPRATEPVLPIPQWALELVAAIEQSEDNHARYYIDTYRGMEPLDQCPESQFLEMVPDSVRETARRWAS